MTVVLWLEILLALLIFLFGSCIFSFLNVVIYRLPAKKSFAKGFSACPSCGHRLYGKDMVPIVSWLFLRGKCRYCGAPVSARYSIVEGIGGVFALLCAYQYGQVPQQGILVFAFLSVLTVVTFIDADTMEIPDGLNIAIFILGIISIFLMPEITLVSRIIGFFCVSVPMLLIAMFVPGGFGGGDIKLVAAVGVFLGWKYNALAAMLGIFLGGFYGMWLLLMKKADRKAHFAFGPFLCAGMIISLFFGNEIIHWWLG